MNAKLLFCTIIILGLALVTQAQNTRFDLTKQPTAVPLNAGTSNASLLKAATTQQPDSTLLTPKGMNEGTYTGKGLNDNQYQNMQRTQFKLGNAKATSTIYYDEAGKVKGQSTTISGGK